jgi:hypothetical protein
MPSLGKKKKKKQKTKRKKKHSLFLFYLTQVLYITLAEVQVTPVCNVANPRTLPSF